MRFIEFHGHSETKVTFALDFAVKIEPAKNKRHTFVRLITGEEYEFEIDYEEFIAEVFSDLHGEKEYQLITINYTEPQPMASK